MFCTNFPLKIGFPKRFDNQKYSYFKKETFSNLGEINDTFQKAAFQNFTSFGVPVFYSVNEAQMFFVPLLLLCRRILDLHENRHKLSCSRQLWQLLANIHVSLLTREEALEHYNCEIPEFSRLSLIFSIVCPRTNSIPEKEMISLV